MATRIDTVSAREKLTPRRNPYWHKLSTGCYVGFRLMTSDSTGTWIARYWDDAHRKQRFHSFGPLDDLPAHKRFDKAVELAREWFDHIGAGGMTKAYTVAEACAAYIKHIRTEKGDAAADDAQGRFDRWVLNTPLAKIELSKLKRDHIRRFRSTLINAPVTVGGETRERAKDTINRDMSPLRAALNRAFADGKVTTDFAWREDLKPIKNASRRRELYLDIEQRRRLISAAAPDIAAFLRGMSILPLRPGALAALKVGDFDKRLKTIKVGKDKAGADRRLTLPVAAVEFLSEQADGRPAAAPLLARADGAMWNKDSWKEPVKEAVLAAALPPEATAYTLRHSVITDLVVGGLDLLTVAQISGTSVAMIEKHYGHLRQNTAAEALAKLVL